MNRSRSTSSDSAGHRTLGDKRISYSILLWSSIAIVSVILSLSLLPSATVFAQASSADKASDQKRQTTRKSRARRTRSKANARRSSKRSARGNQGVRSEEGEQVDAQPRVLDRSNGRNRTNASKGEFDESEGADSEGERRENGVLGSDQDATEQQGVKTVDSALKQGMAQRSNRMEFDARLVYGETAGSGAVILFERGQRNLPPLTKQRTKFLAATTEPIFGKKGPSRYPDSEDNKKDKSDTTEKKSTIDGLRN